MAKEIKTNAMRILEKKKISYKCIQYECDNFIDGLHTAEKTKAPIQQSFHGGQYQTVWCSAPVNCLAH